MICYVIKSTKLVTTQGSVP